MSGRVTRHRTVFITYAIFGEGGAELERCDLPVGYVHGAGSGLLEKVETALEGRGVGDRVEVALTPEEGFGPRRPELTFTDDIENVPPEHRVLGSEVEFENEKGERLQFRVTRIADGKLTIDANHPLAGQALRFVVQVTDIRPATPEEIARGLPQDSPLSRLH